jgi:hypothetical protein
MGITAAAAHPRGGKLNLKHPFRRQEAALRDSVKQAAENPALLTSLQHAHADPLGIARKLDYLIALLDPAPDVTLVGRSRA